MLNTYTVEVTATYKEVITVASTSRSDAVNQALERTRLGKLQKAGAELDNVSLSVRDSPHPKA